MGYTYILLCSNNTYYVGSTNELVRRMREHMNGLSKATMSKLPVKLVFSKEFQTLREARSYEYFIKRQRNRAFYEELINGPIV